MRTKARAYLNGGALDPVRAYGRIVGASSEGYKNFRDCKLNFERLLERCDYDVEA